MLPSAPASSSSRGQLLNPRPTQDNRTVPTTSSEISTGKGIAAVGGRQSFPLQPFKQSDLETAGLQSSNPISKTRKRTKDGCLTCRADKKGCDKQHPKCLRCIRLNYECIWPDPANPPKRRKAKSRESPKAARIDEAPTDSSDILACAIGNSRALGDTINSNVKESSTINFDAAVSSAAVSNQTGGELVRRPVPGAYLNTFSITNEPPSGASYIPGWTGQTVPSELSPFNVFELLGGNLDQSTASETSTFWNDTLLYDFHLSPDLKDGLSLVESTDTTASERVVVTREKLAVLATYLPRKIYAIVERMVAEQGNEGESCIPVSYIINVGMWLPARAIRDLEKQAHNVYSAHPLLRSLLSNIGDDYGALLNSQTMSRTVRPTVTAEQICALENISVETKVQALVDMAFRAFFIKGAAAWYAQMTLIEKHLCQYLKPGRVINLGALASIEMFGVTNWMWADICRSVALAQPTVFPYVFDVRSGVPTLTGTQYSSGSSDIINCLIADISNLRFAMDRDLTSRPTPHTISEMYQSRVDRIHQEILHFMPRLLEGEKEDYEGDSLLSVGSLAVQELWSQAAMIHFFQSIYRYPSSHSELQKCLKISLSLCSIIEISAAVKLDAMTSLPVFLSATVAVTPVDRQHCRRRMEGLGKVGGQAAAHRQNKQLIELVWSESDRIGKPVDWHDYASEMNGPCFM